MENSYEHLLTLDYAAIQSLPQLQRYITEYETATEHLTKLIYDLNDSKEKQQFENSLILDNMRAKMTENGTRIDKMKKAIDELSEQQQRWLKEFEEEKEKHKKNLEMAHQAEMNVHISRLEQLETAYSGLKDFEDRETNYLLKIETLKQGIIQKQYEHHDNMNKEELRQKQQNEILQTSKSENVDQVRRNAYDFARGIVMQEKSENEEKNVRLKAKLFQLQEELSRLKKERNALAGKSKELKMNIAINQQELEEYKAVGSLQKAKIKAVQDKIDLIKANIDEEVLKREQKIAETTKEQMMRMKALKERLANIEQQKQETSQRMANMKFLSETILQQRNDVEQFFIMTLEACKRQANEEEGKGIIAETRPYGQKVDIEQLSAKDRLRILTNLYTKLALGP